MIALKGDEVILIDVKTFYERNRTHEKNQYSGDFTTGLNLLPSQKRTKKQIKMGVKILGFNPETRELRFVEHTK